MNKKVAKIILQATGANVTQETPDNYVDVA